MKKIKDKFHVFLIVTLFTCASILSDCGGGGGVDEEQMASLNNLKAEVESLQGQVKAKEDEKISLEKQISDKDAKIKKYKDDIVMVENYFEDDERDIPIKLISNVNATYYLINRRTWNGIPQLVNSTNNLSEEILLSHSILPGGTTTKIIYTNWTVSIVVFEYNLQFKTSELKPERSPNYKTNPQETRIDF